MDKVTFDRDSAGEWRWHRRDEGNHKTTGAASEGFDTYRNAYNNAYGQFGDTVEYVKWKHEDTGDPRTTMTVEGDPPQTTMTEVELDDGSTPEN